MDNLFIFGAKYLWLTSAIIFAYVFWKSQVKKRLVIFTLLVLPISYAVAKVLGHFYYDPRPFVVGAFTPLIAHAADNGFPSDHALLVGALAAAITPFSRKWAIWLWIIAILVAISRVYVGVHHTIDVVASLGISALVALVIYSSGKFKQSGDANQ